MVKASGLSLPLSLSLTRYIEREREREREGERERERERIKEKESEEIKRKREEARPAALLIGLIGAEDPRDTFIPPNEHGRASLRLGLQCSTPVEWMCLGVEH